MKKGGGHSKGADFERYICKKLSLWWTQDYDNPRDDIFWRTAGSGARATMRSKRHMSTCGGYGDIMSIDPVGKDLTDACCFELKRGYSPDLFAWFKKGSNDLIQAWEQCVRSAKQAHARFPVLIFKPDRQPIFMMSSTRLLLPFCSLLSEHPRISIFPLDCTVCLFERFLADVSAVRFKDTLCVKPKRVEV